MLSQSDEKASFAHIAIVAMNMAVV